jgi:hypothetical protein
LPGSYNYFIGNDPKKWRTDVRSYGEVTYRDVWDGIDLRIYGNGRDLEQEFIVRPGGDLTKVRVAYRGIDGLRVADDGSLVVRTAFGDIRETRPRVFQEIADERVPVQGRFKLTSNTAYTFDVPAHQGRYALLIDPTLLYSTYLGGGSTDQAAGVAVDKQGSAYVTGFTDSSNFPTTPGAIQTTEDSTAGFVTKFTSLGDNVVYSTYLGSQAGYGADGTGIAVDAAGEAYVVGYTGGAFPTDSNSFQQKCPAGNTSAFLGDLCITAAVI